MILDYIVWDVNPYIFKFPEGFPILGGHPVAWYGLLWAMVFVVGYYIMRKVYRKEKLSDELLDKLTIYMLIFSILGARLGHCLFYEPGYYLANPEKFLFIWEGGLASHGGAIGILIGLLIYAKKVKKSYLWILDLMNSEIYGYETTLPWGFKFVRDWAPGTPLDVIPACHPTQIYEALVCVIVFVVLMYLYFRKDTAYKHPGFFFGLFCTAIFGSRILIEFIKQPQVEFESSMTLDMGQWLSIPFVIAGIFFIVRSYKQVRS